MNLRFKFIVVEIFWWLGSALTALLFLLPIRMYPIQYPFWFSNLFFIILACTYGRWIFLWKYTPYAWSLYTKAALILMVAFSFFYGFNLFYEFRAYLNETGIQDLVDSLDPPDQISLSKYVRTEMVFWATCFLILAAMTPFRLFWSIWTQYNRNEV